MDENDVHCECCPAGKVLLNIILNAYPKYHKIPIFIFQIHPHSK